MSLLSSFIQNQFLKALEHEFSAHAPDVQQFLVKEVEAFANSALSWVESKLNSNQQKSE